MKKRLIAVLCVVAVLVMALAGCGKKNNETAPSDDWDGEVYDISKGTKHNFVDLDSKFNYWSDDFDAEKEAKVIVDGQMLCMDLDGKDGYSKDDIVYIIANEYEDTEGDVAMYTIPVVWGSDIVIPDNETPVHAEGVWKHVEGSQDNSYFAMYIDILETK